MNWADISEYVIQSKLLNASFTNAMLAGFGACFGAGIGAFLAQRLSGRAKLKERLRQEVLRTNAAITLALSITNLALGLKKQHVKTLWETFATTRKQAEKVYRGEYVEQPFEFYADLQTINLTTFPVGNLQDLVFTKIAANAKALTTVTALCGSVDSLHEFVKNRNELVQGFKARFKIDKKEFPAVYFGLINQDGHVDATYATVLEAISRGTDDCIYFSLLLQEELARTGKASRALFVKQFGKNIPHILEPNFVLAENLGLLPDPKNYEDWAQMFIERQPELSVWRKSTKWLREAGKKSVRWGQRRTIYLHQRFRISWLAARKELR